MKLKEHLKSNFFLLFIQSSVASVLIYLLFDALYNTMFETKDIMGKGLAEDHFFTCSNFFKNYGCDFPEYIDNFFSFKIVFLSPVILLMALGITFVLGRFLRERPNK